MQSSPLIFVLTGFIVAIGIDLFVKSYLNQNKPTDSEKINTKIYSLNSDKIN